MAMRSNRGINWKMAGVLSLAAPLVLGTACTSSRGGPGNTGTLADLAPGAGLTGRVSTQYVHTAVGCDQGQLRPAAIVPHVVADGDRDDGPLDLGDALHDRRSDVAPPHLVDRELAVAAVQDLRREEVSRFVAAVSTLPRTGEPCLEVVIGVHQVRTGANRGSGHEPARPDAPTRRYRSVRVPGEY